MPSTSRMNRFWHIHTNNDYAAAIETCHHLLCGYTPSPTSAHLGPAVVSKGGELGFVVCQKGQSVKGPRGEGSSHRESPGKGPFPAHLRRAPRAPIGKYKN